MCFVYVLLHNNVCLIPAFISISLISWILLCTNGNVLCKDVVQLKKFEPVFVDILCKSFLRLKDNSYPLLHKRPLNTGTVRLQRLQETRDVEGNERRQRRAEEG